MDYGFRRPKRSWESSDGAIHLLANIAPTAPNKVAGLMPLLVQVAESRHFNGWQQLQETLWGRLPAVARGLGKKVGAAKAVGAAILWVCAGLQVLVCAAALERNSSYLCRPRQSPATYHCSNAVSLQAS